MARGAIPELPSLGRLDKPCEGLPRARECILVQPLAGCNLDWNRQRKVSELV